MKLSKDDKNFLAIFIGVDAVFFFLNMGYNFSSYTYPLQAFGMIIIFCVINFVMGMTWGSLRESRSQTAKHDQIKNAIIDILNSRRKDKANEALDLILRPGDHSIFLSRYDKNPVIVKPRHKYLPNSFTEFTELLAWVSVVAGTVFFILGFFSLNLWLGVPITMILTFILVLIVGNTQGNQ